MLVIMKSKPIIISKTLVWYKMIMPFPNTFQLEFFGIFSMSTEKYSRIVVWLISLTLTPLKETQNLHKG